MEEAITIQTGEKKVIKLNFFNSFGIVYCGMPNEKIFSLSYLESAGYQGYGLNLYYPKGMSRIRIKNIEFNVLSITPENIKIQKTESI